MDGEIYDLCIVGAGMFGSAAARHASMDPTLKVCLIGPCEPTVAESREREIFSSHYDEGRIVQVIDAKHAVAVLSKHSISRLRELEKLSGIQFYTPLGFLITAEKNNSDMNEVLHCLHSNKFPFVDLSDNNIFQKRFPYLQMDECEYRFFDDNGAGCISARRTVEAQKKVARLQGCHVIEDVVDEVKDLEDRIHEVVTEKVGIIKAKRVLICTGAFTNYKRFHPLKKLSMIINKETVAMLRVSEKEAQALSSMPPIVYMRNDNNISLTTHDGAYILPPIKYPDGKYYLKAGPLGILPESIPTLQEVKEWYLSKGDKDEIHSLTVILEKLLPGIHFEEINGKTCLTCHNSTKLPYIDRISPTVSVAVVGNGIGASVCDEVGRIAAKLCLSGEWRSELPKSLFEVKFEL